MSVNMLDVCLVAILLPQVHKILVCCTDYMYSMQRVKWLAFSRDAEFKVFSATF